MMIHWVLIVALLVVIFLLVKLKEIRHRSFMIFFVIILIFVIITAGQLVSKNNINLSKFEDVMLLGKLYFSWLKHVLGNLVQLTGNAVKQDWSLNMSNITIK